MKKYKNKCAILHLIEIQINFLKPFQVEQQKNWCFLTQNFILETYTQYQWSILVVYEAWSQKPCKIHTHK